MKYLKCSVCAIFAISLLIGCSHLNNNIDKDNLPYSGTALIVKKSTIDNEKEVVVYCDLYLISDKNDFLTIGNLSEKNCRHFKVGDKINVEVKNNKVIRFNNNRLP